MKKILYSILGAALASSFLVVFVAHANPGYFTPLTSTATATTTVSYMTAGTATTTLPLDSYVSGTPNALNQATLITYMYASSSVSSVNINIEYSQNNTDWFQDGGTFTTGFATTSKAFDISVVKQFNWNFASSTAGLPALGANAATSSRALFIQTPTRYVRAVFTVPIGAAPSGVWAQFVPLKQTPNNQ